MADSENFTNPSPDVIVTKLDNLDGMIHKQWRKGTKV